MALPLLDFSRYYRNLAMLLYLDLNCFNRPFDDQSQDRIAQETAAVFSARQRITDGIDHLPWSAEEQTHA